MKRAPLVSDVVERGLEPRTACPSDRSAAACDPAVTPLPIDDQVYLFLTSRPQLDAVKTGVAQAPWRRGCYELAGLQVR